MLRTGYWRLKKSKTEFQEKENFNKKNIKKINYVLLQKPQEIK